MFSSSKPSQAQQFEVNYLRISADQKAFIQHKVCFKQCIKNMAIPSLDATEHECVKSCLFKFNAVERLMIQKMKQVMETYIQGDPNLKKAIQQQGKHKKQK